MLATQQRPSVHELLCGRWAVSLRGWLIFSSLILIVPFASFNALLNAPQTVVGALIVAQWLAASAIYLGAHLTVLRHRRTRPVSIAVVVGLAVLLGVTRVSVALLLAALLPSLHLTLSNHLLLVLALAIVPGGGAFFLLITFLIAVEEWFSTERARLLRFEIDAEAARLQALGALDATRAVMTARIRGELEEQLTTLGTFAQGEQRLQLSGTVLEAAASYVRPTSHSLWHAPETPPRPSSLRQLERTSLQSPLPILLPFVIWLVAVLPLSIAHSGLRQTFGSVVAILVGMLIFYPLGRRAIRRYAPAPRYARARLLLIASIALATLPLLAAAAATDAWTGSRNAVPLFAIGVFVSFLSTWVVSLGQAGLRTQDERLRSLRSRAEEAQFQRLALEAATEQMQRELALYLHGTVQAGLVASAYAIQDAAARGDEMALERAIAEARVSAGRIGEHQMPPSAVDLNALRSTIDGAWQGMVAIDWVLPADALAAHVLDRIGNVIQECLANASIHGAATEAQVHIAAGTDGVLVEITDNGNGVGAGAPGLGSAVLTEATRGRWTIATASTGGTQVRATVPV